MLWSSLLCWGIIFKGVWHGFKALQLSNKEGACVAEVEDALMMWLLLTTSHVVKTTIAPIEAWIPLFDVLAGTLLVLVLFKRAGRKWLHDDFVVAAYVVAADYIAGNEHIKGYWHTLSSTTAHVINYSMLQMLPAAFTVIPWTQLSSNQLNDFSNNLELWSGEVKHQKRMRRTALLASPAFAPPSQVLSDSKPGSLGRTARKYNTATAFNPASFLNIDSNELTSTELPTNAHTLNPQQNPLLARRGKFSMAAASAIQSMRRKGNLKR